MKKNVGFHSSTASPEAKQRLIVKAVLARVPESGWTDLAYKEGLKATGIGHADADRLMPFGIRDVIRLFGDEIDHGMQASIDTSRSYARMRVRDKVAFGVRARFEALEPHREIMRRLLVWYAMPMHAPIALKRLYKTTDLIWQAAGDASTDYNFYTKRLLLAAVIKATTLFWLSDESEGREATWAFLGRRINEVVKAGKTLSLLKEWKPSEIAGMVRGRFKRA